MKGGAQMNLMKIAFCVCVAVMLWAVPVAAQGGPGACLVIINETGRVIYFTIDGWPGQTFVYQVGDRMYVGLLDGVEIKSSTGTFTLRGARGTVLNTTWTFRADLTGGPGHEGTCKGSDVATFHP